MPGITCACGTQISYGEIPCANEWLFLSDPDFEKLTGQVDAEAIYRAMKSFLRCPRCGRLWVFWNGYGEPPQEFLPGPRPGPDEGVP